MAKKIRWAESIWFFDIDDTLCNTSDVSGMATEGIRRIFGARFGDEVGLKMKNYVNEFYDLMLSGYRIKTESDWNDVKGGKNAFEILLKSVSDCQKSVQEKYGMPKKWSREIFVKLAADKLGIKVTSELINEAVDAYWIELSKITNVFPDAVELLKIVKAHKRPIYLMTSSDARLIMQPDGQFLYYPEYSEALKRERIELLREKGIDYNLLSIGDPEDKPNLDFFEKGINLFSNDLGFPIDTSKSIMIGDSFAGDLKTPKENLGFGLVVLVDRSVPHFDYVDEHQINTDNLSKIVNYFTIN